MSTENKPTEKEAVEIRPKKDRTRRYIYVEKMPEDAEAIEHIRKQDPDGLFFSPSNNQFYRKVITPKGIEKIRLVLPSAKGFIHCPDKNKKSVCVSVKRFRKIYMQEHPGVYVPPITQELQNGKEGDNLPLDPSEEEELFQDMRRALSNLFEKHVHFYGRFDVLARLLRGLETEFPNGHKAQDKSGDSSTEGSAHENSTANASRSVCSTEKPTEANEDENEENEEELNLSDL